MSPKSVRPTRPPSQPTCGKPRALLLPEKRLLECDQEQLDVDKRAGKA